jgi:hypothetical protein
MPCHRGHGGRVTCCIAARVLQYRRVHANTVDVSVADRFEEAFADKVKAFVQSVYPENYE